jgi:hypothetical protein
VTRDDRHTGEEHAARADCAIAVADRNVRLDDATHDDLRQPVIAADGL